MTKTRNFWNRLISTLWFVPTLFVFCGIILGILLIGVDYLFGSPFRYLPIFFGAQTSGARDILSVIADETIKEIRKSFPTEENPLKIDKKTEGFLAKTDCLKANANKTGYVQNADTFEMFSLFTFLFDLSNS